MLDLSLILSQIADCDFTPLILAVVLGGIVGFEREIRGRPAGLRTHILVCMCSTVLMITARHVPASIPDQVTVVFDPQRLAAGVVTGIGFLGAAAVVRSGDIVRGLTTGASVWGVAGLGVVIGQEAYGYAVVLTSVMLFVLLVLDLLPGSFSSVVYRRLKVRSRGGEMRELSELVRSILARGRVRVQEISGTVGVESADQFELSFHVRCRDTMRAPEILEEVKRLAGVVSADWTVPRR